MPAALLLGGLGAASFAMALAVFVAFVRLDLLAAILAWGPFPGRWPDPARVHDRQVDLMRAMARRVRWLLLAILAATSFTAGAVMMWVRLCGQL